MEKTYGGPNYDSASTIIETSGGFIVASTTESSASAFDAWVIKVDATGNVLWQKSFDLAFSDYLLAASQTLDGGLAFVGSSNSEWWMIKTDANGNVAPTCTFITDTSVVAADFNPTISDLTTTPTNTSLTLVTPSASAMNNSEAPTELCSSQDIAPGANDDAYTVTQNSTSNVLYVLANDTDPDDDFLNLIQVTDPPNGTAVIVVDNWIEYTPDPNFTGTDSFTYYMSDLEDGSDSATVTITVNAPSACEYEDQFEDGTIDLLKWTILKPSFVENTGNMIATPTR